MSDEITLCKICGSTAKTGFSYCKNHMPPGAIYNDELARKQRAWRNSIISKKKKTETKFYSKSSVKLKYTKYSQRRKQVSGSKSYKMSKSDKQEIIKRLCQAIAASTGKQCQNYPLVGSAFCIRHQNPSTRKTVRNRK